jgi:hypothetical protein
VVVVVSILRLYSSLASKRIPKTLSESIGYKQLLFHYELTERPRQ